MDLDENIIKGIIEIIEEIKRENNIRNEIIRDDVFSILQACDCIVLYYPLDGEEQDGCDGCHIEKPVNGRMEQFVFINTNNTRERQAFSAAHELGHIWRVDQRVREKVPLSCKNDAEMNEKIIDRFAAELLMPRDLFIEAINNWFKETKYIGSNMKITDIIKLIAYLMNYFFVPFKSVVIRLNELNKLDEIYNDIILKYKDSELLYEIIKTEQYTRLGIVNKLKSIDKLPEYLVQLEEAKIFNETKIANIRKLFDIGNLDKVSDIDVIFQRGE